ncbi:hypothetical protein SAMN06264365_1345 [Actinoplanes regularis]|uniref:Uncharacterized protein n=1 Tax=Actinoplanes regularis TaxID=52697 RepID=A0A239JBI2_9ACTN|nr:hypothetical protein SAMN06264365_1345 [Actinoplanes regularis]
MSRPFRGRGRERLSSWLSPKEGSCPKARAASAGVLILNTARRARVALLPDPDRPANDRTLDPGKPLLDRTAAYGLLVPALLIIYVAVNASHS